MTRKQPRALTEPEAIARWQSLAKQLEYRGYGLKEFDALDRYAVAFNDWLRASERIASLGLVVRGMRKDEIVVSPYLTARDQAAAIMKEAASDLPFTVDGTIIGERPVTMADFLATV